MSSILLEPIIPNLTKVGASGEQLRDLWKLFTKVKDNTQGGRRLENLYWRLWYQSSSTGQQKETEKISSLFQTWRGPGEDFKAAAVSKRRTLNCSSSSSSSSSSGENCEENVETVVENLEGEKKATLLTSSSSVRLEQGQQDCKPASTGASASSTLTSTVTANPGSTSFISIPRVSSNLKAMGAAAAAAAAPPAADLKVPAIPVTIMPKKAVTGKSCTTTTPSKLSVGFFSETAAVQRPSTAITTTTTTVASSKTSVGFMTSTVSSNSTTGTDPPAPAPAPALTKANEHGARKKFFINSLSSVSSEESLHELAAPAKVLPPAFHTASSSTNLTQDPSLSFFNKVAPPEPPLAPEEVPPKNPACPSNLSSLLKNPRRPTRNVNILATAQYYRRRDADYSPQFLESESLKRCLQIDHKPLIDPSLAYGGGTPMTYSENPAAW